MGSFKQRAWLNAFNTAGEIVTNLHRPRVGRHAFVCCCHDENATPAGFPLKIRDRATFAFEKAFFFSSHRMRHQLKRSSSPGRELQAIAGKGSDDRELHSAIDKRQLP